MVEATKSCKIYTYVYITHRHIHTYITHMYVHTHTQTYTHIRIHKKTHTHRHICTQTIASYLTYVYINIIGYRAGCTYTLAVNWLLIHT